MAPAANAAAEFKTVTPIRAPAQRKAEAPEAGAAK